MRSDLDWNSGYKRFDFHDLLTTLSYGNGFLDVRTADISSEDFQQYMNVRVGTPDLENNKFPEVRTRSLICGAHDINTTKRFAGIVGIPKEWVKDPELRNYAIDFGDYILREITKKAKCNDFIHTLYIDPKLKNIEVTVLCSGMPLSQKVYRMVKSIGKELNKDREKAEVEALDLSDLGL